MAHKVKSQTFSTISNAPKTSISEVRVHGHSELDLQPMLAKMDTVSSVIIEGFKKDAMAAAMEIEGTLSAMNQTFTEKMDDLRHDITTISDCVVMSKDIRDLQEAFEKNIANLDYKVGKIADNIKALDIDLCPLVDAIKNLNLKAEIPITALTIKVPTAISLMFLLAPFLWGSVIWILLHLISR